MEIILILVEPAVPENIGFSLRAMKTMGFGKLRIVGPVDLEADGLRKTAYGSHDLLDQIEQFEDLASALQDIDLSVGTTSKQRTIRKDVIEAKDLKGFIESKGDTIGRVAIVFGSEENGLSKEDINKCNAVSTISLATDYPSLNLAQSVLIYAYELSGSNDKSRNDQDSGLYKVMLEQSEELIDWLELDSNPVLLRRLKDRLALASETDIHLLMSVIKKLRRKMKDD